MKSFALLLLGVALIGIARAQTADLQKAAKANLYSGFGKGFLMMGDTTTARTFRCVEIGGWSGLGVGTVGLVGTKLVYDFLVASVGKVTTADFYVFGGIALAGLTTVVASRVLAYNRLLKPSVGLCALPGGGVPTIGITLQL